ncbi:MAG: hypothetical protein ACI4T6_12130 [Candidatus Flemingiibacterium sp.]
MKMKRTISALAALAMASALGLTGCDESIANIINGRIEKPVIYLYPEKTTEVSVDLSIDGEFVSVYPEFNAENSGWTVTAEPDGRLFVGGREYYCLFWEGETGAEYDFSKGFCVAGEDTAEFLRDTLGELGLTPREANEFIIYWLPRMEHNAYNLISFQTDAYTDAAELCVSPEPDSLIRVFMAFRPLETPVEIEPQELSSPERSGFTVVEWGGSEVR